MEEKAKAGEKEIGKITHYFGHVEVGIIEISSGELKIGDKIAIRGHSTNIEQEVKSMQIEHEEVEAAKEGDSVGTKVKERVRPGDKVFKIGD
jgi:translation elongation factor EF-1alpha